MSMQRADLRDKYNLRGNCATDIATACCCVVCDLVQQEKESEHREALVSPPGVQQQGYQMQGAMSYPSADAPAAPPPVPSSPVQEQEKEQEKGQEKGQEAGVTTSEDCDGQRSSTNPGS